MEDVNINLTKIADKADGQPKNIIFQIMYKLHKNIQHMDVIILVCVIIKLQSVSISSV